VTEAAGKPMVKKATAAKTVLLKALGFTPSDMEVNDDDLAILRRFFDSPMSDGHMRAVATIFGKAVPISFDQVQEFQVAVSTH
jgi:hypothetical protein